MEDKSALNSENNTKKIAYSFFIILVLFFFVFIAQNILFPIILGFIFAILLFPLVSFFSKKWLFPNELAVLLSLVLAIGFFVFLFFILSKQISSLFQDLPEISKNLNLHYNHIQSWINNQFHITALDQKQFLQKSVSSNNINPANSFKSLGSITDVLMNTVLIPIYTFLILIYRKNLIQFINLLFSKSINTTKNTVHDVVNEINHVIRNYILGLLIEMLAVSLLTGFGLWIIGLKYFIFLAILTAILNLIPYIGILVACVISILMTLVGSSDLSLITGVIVVNIIVQFIDNNILIPKIVGSKVRINALASMIGVIVGGTIAGVGGMFLALPILAILKIILDKSENLRAFAYLISDNPKKKISFLSKFKKTKIKSDGINKKV